MTVKLLTEHRWEFISLKGGHTGLSESTLAKLPYCWKSHVTAHMLLVTIGIVSMRHFTAHMLLVTIGIVSMRHFTAHMLLITNGIV